MIRLIEIKFKGAENTNKKVLRMEALLIFVNGNLKSNRLS